MRDPKSADRNETTARPAPNARAFRSRRAITSPGALQIIASPQSLARLQKARL
jgi:hypothetical protein